jgi:hypothetical protein
MRGCMCWDVDVYTKAREGQRVARAESARGKKTVELAKAGRGNVPERGKARERPARNQRS